MGLFPLVALIVLASLLSVAALYRGRAPPTSEVYTCGEGSEVQVGTFYYWTEARVARLMRTANMLMALLVIALVFAPVIQEVAA